MSELEKWSKVHESVIQIEEFLQWLNEQGLQICRVESDVWGTRYYVASKTFRQLTESFFDIDPVTLEEERRALLDSIKED
jgi:hypothetical protein